MTRDEAIQTLSKVGKISVSYADDLYDSFVPKPIVPQFVADWYEVNKEYLDYNIWEFVKHWDMQPEDEFKKWMLDDDKNPIITLVNMRQFGYEVEKETRYTVEFKGIDDNYRFLNYGTSFKDWTFDDGEGAKGVRVAHTRKELEANGFGWVFNCEGVEVKEVTDEQPNK